MPNMRIPGRTYRAEGEIQCVSHDGHDSEQNPGVTPKEGFRKAVIVLRSLWLRNQPNDRALFGRHGIGNVAYEAPQAA